MKRTKGDLYSPMNSFSNFGVQCIKDDMFVYAVVDISADEIDGPEPQYGKYQYFNKICGATFFPKHADNPSKKSLQYQIQLYKNDEFLQK